MRCPIRGKVVIQCETDHVVCAWVVENGVIGLPTPMTLDSPTRSFSPAVICLLHQSRPMRDCDSLTGT